MPHRVIATWTLYDGRSEKDIEKEAGPCNGCGMGERNEYTL